MDGKQRVALIGAGYWGKNHLRNLYELGVLRTVMDADDRTLEQQAPQYPGVRFVNDEERILEDPGVQAVVIAAPACYHHPLARRCLVAGKDVLVEKPLALHVHQGEELVELARENERILMVGHILQYHPAVRLLKEIIDFGDIGEVRYLYSNRLNLGRLRTEENVLWSFAPHDISVILMLMDGQPPVSVSAFGGSYITGGVYDTSVTELRFENQVLSHIYVSWLHPFKEQKLVVIGSTKMAVFDDLSADKLLLYPYKVDFRNGIVPVFQKVEYYTVRVPGSEPLREELLHFLDCVDRRLTPRTDGEEGLRVLRVLEAAQHSLADHPQAAPAAGAAVQGAPA
ncbi:MAG: Gfo/Idh/MocA family protein [Spirochaetota bacterium]